jgi:prepilin-type N-terminal cleavage/methylation domain-containing protein/prepilin-type processing-associated H-X9-DG protein
MRDSIRRGFTLIELLVVLAIMSLLIALLAPSLAHARSSSRTAKCGSNLHQLGTLHFEQSWDLDEWALSAYDLRDERWALVAGADDPPGESKSNGQIEKPPSWVRNFGKRLYQWETTAPAQPLHWSIPCPEAIPLSEMSYGMNCLLRGIKPEHIVPTDPVFACSPYRLLARGRDMDPARHGEQVNFMYGDSHVTTDPITALPERDAYRTTWRPEPIPAEYPDD